jgi:hypothetical protein
LRLAKETIFNDAVQNLSRGVSGYRTIPVGGLTTLELMNDADDLSLYGTLVFTGVLTANCTVIVPARARILILDNRTTGSFTLTVKTASGTGVVVPQGVRAHTYSDGLNVYLVSDSASAGAALPVASESVAGITRYGTAAETSTGLLSTVAVHPAGLKTVLDALPPAPAATTSVAGIAPLATPAEGLTGTNNTKIVTSAVMQAKINAIPAATDTVLGLSERATPTEAIAGTDPSRFITPATLKAVVDTLPVTPVIGAAYSLLRIPSGGSGQEASPSTVNAAGELTVRASGAGPSLTVVSEHTAGTGTFQHEAYFPSNNTTMSLTAQRAAGSAAVPVRLTAAQGQTLWTLFIQGYLRNSSDTADAWVTMGRVSGGVDSMDAQGRAGGYLSLMTAPAGSNPAQERLRMDQAGNLNVGGGSTVTGLSAGLTINQGTAAGSVKANAVQVWAADRNALAGQMSLHVLTEGGTKHVIGDMLGAGTWGDVSLGSGAFFQALSVKGSALFVGDSSVQERAVAAITASFPTSTDATRKGRVVFSAYDAVAGREFLRGEASGTASMLSFHGVAAVLRQTINAAATDTTTTQALVNTIRTALINYGLCV